MERAEPRRSISIKSAVRTRRSTNLTERDSVQEARPSAEGDRKLAGRQHDQCLHKLALRLPDEGIERDWVERQGEGPCRAWSRVR